MAAAQWPQGRAACYLQKSNGSVTGNGQKWPFYGAPKHSLKAFINTSRSAKLTFPVKVIVLKTGEVFTLKNLTLRI